MVLPAFLLAFVQWSHVLISMYGYFGIFLISLIANLTIIFPIPAFALVFALGSTLNPWLVGLSAGIGGGLGEFTGYLLGRGGREAIIKKYNSQIKKIQGWAQKHGIFPLIIFIAATPLPSDVVGIFCGLIRYSFKKFLLASIIGKIIKNTYIAVAGFYSFELIKILFGAG